MRLVLTNKKGTITAPSLQHHCSITAASLHHRCSITAPSLHHHRTITAPSLHHHYTITAPSLHHHCTITITAQSPHHHCTITAGHESTAIIRLVLFTTIFQWLFIVGATFSFNCDTSISSERNLQHIMLKLGQKCTNYETGGPVLQYCTASDVEFSVSLSFNSTMLVNCSNIKTLKLNYNNKWQSITAGAFRTLPNLRSLYIENCESIESIENNAFEGLHKLEKLEILQLRRLKSIQNGAFNGLKNLKRLFIVTSAITSVTRYLQPLANVTFVDLRYNQIETLEKNAFKGLQKLETVDLLQNKIRHISIGTFTGTRIKHLWMQNNPSQCTIINSTEATCTCARDRYSEDPTMCLSGGELGGCVCPPGQYYHATTNLYAGQCQRCTVGTYNDRMDATTCKQCATHYTRWMGATSEANCTENPLLKETQWSEQNAELQKKLFSYAVIIGAGLVAMFIVCVMGCWRMAVLQRRGRKAESEVHQLELALKDSEMNAQEQQLRFFRDWRIKESEIELGAVVAEGAEGKVFRGTLLSSNKTVAVKKSKVETQAAVWSEAEIAFMMSVHHPRLVEFIGAGQMFDKKNQGNVSFCVVEFLDGGSLNTRLWGKPRESVTWQERLRWSLDTSEGLKYIHGRGFTHRDIKSGNILYDIESGRAKVADFGMSRDVLSRAEPADEGSASRQSPQMLMTDAFGTLEYMAPELCTTQTHRTYDKSVDVYAFAITMHELMTHEKPWHTLESKSKISDEVARGNRPLVPGSCDFEAPPGWCPLMNACWSQDAEARPSFEAVFSSLSEMMDAHTGAAGVEMGSNAPEHRHTTVELNRTAVGDSTGVQGVR